MSHTKAPYLAPFTPEVGAQFGTVPYVVPPATTQAQWSEARLGQE